MAYKLCLMTYCLLLWLDEAVFGKEKQPVTFMCEYCSKAFNQPGEV